MSSHYSKVEWQIPAVLTLSLSYSVSVGQRAVQHSLQELFSAITEDLMAMMCRYYHFFLVLFFTHANQHHALTVGNEIQHFGMQDT